MFDDDFFEPVRGPRASNSTYDSDGVFGTGAAAAPAYDVFTSSNRSAPPSYDDFLGGFGGKPQAEEIKTSVVVEDDDDLLGGFGMKPAGEKKKSVVDEDQQGNGFDDLIPGFASSSPPKSRNTNDDNKKKPAVPASKSTASFVDDPFVVLERVSVPGSDPSPGRFTDPLEDLDKSANTKGKNVDSAAAADSLFEDPSAFDQVLKSDPLFTSEINGDTKDSHLQSKARESSSVQSSVKRNPASRSSLEDFGNGMPKSQSARYSDIHVDDSSERYSGNGMDDQSTISTESEDDIWLTVSEIPLFTRPISAPPPSRSPPLLKQKPLGAKANGEDDEYVPQSSQKHNHYKDTPEQADDSSVDESEGVAMGKHQMPAYYDKNAFDDDEEFDSNSSAREERESQERLEHAREMRLREEQRRLEKERVLEQQREKQAVERATKEARERAAAEAHAKAERDARQRSQRAAVQRAHQEARERAAAEAKDRVARAAAEERERAAAEAKERERTAARERAAAERAAAERVQQEARKRAERAAVERAAAEARQRQAAAAAAAAKEKQSTPNDVESFFRMDARDTGAAKQRAPTVDSMFDSQPQGRGTVNGSQRTASTSASTRKANPPSATNIFGNGLSDLFEFESTRSSSDVFQDVEGESEERRRARLERHQRTRERAAKALAEKNERDMQVQREQAERDRIGDSLDFEIKRWAAGKEGNLRALLSTLQYILWPECGWQAVSLTDLITGAAVKKQYRKATLCIHPDKVQQKGATLQQKYIAEKVFDMLKEAWNKFNSEELF